MITLKSSMRLPAVWLVIVLVIALLYGVTSAQGLGGEVRSVAWSPDGCQVVYGGNSSRSSGIMAVEQSIPGALSTPVGNTNSARQEANPITAVSWSPSGKWVALGRADGTVEICEVPSGQTSLVLDGHADAVSTFAWYPDEEQLISGSDLSVLLWDLKAKKLSANLNDQYGLPHNVFSIAWMPDQDSLILSSSGINESPQVWDATTFEKLASVAYGPPLHNMALSPDGRKILAAGVGGAFLTDTVDFAVISGADTGFGISTLAWSRDGQIIATGNWLGAIQLWSISSDSIQLVRTVREEVAVEYHYPHTTIRSLQFNEDGSVLHSLSGNGIYDRWAVPSGYRLGSVKLSDRPLYGAAFSPDGRWLAYENEHGSLAIVPVDNTSR